MLYLRVFMYCCEVDFKDMLSAYYSKKFVTITNLFKPIFSKLFNIDQELMLESKSHSA